MQNKIDIKWQEENEKLAFYNGELVEVIAVGENEESEIRYITWN